MKFATLNLVALATAATAFPSFRIRQDGDAPVGMWQAPGANAVRGPCPAMNALANHGYLPRNGREYTFEMMISALFSVYGASQDLTASLAAAALTLKNDTVPPDSQPFSLQNIKSSFGIRDPGQVNANGEACIDLDQLSLHGAIEHDISLVHADFAQGDNHDVQPVLVQELINASSDGVYLTVDDMTALRASRYSEQVAANPELVFGSKEKMFALGELSLIMGVFGERIHEGRVAIDQLATFLGEERLPINEGWSKRVVPFTLLELNVYMAALALKSKV